MDVAGLNYQKPHDYPVHGIDVSKFQGEIDWSKVADSGVKFAWIKATEGGDRVDERFEANWEGAKAAGVAASRQTAVAAATLGASLRLLRCTDDHDRRARSPVVE